MGRLLLLVLVSCVGLGCHGQQYDPTDCPKTCKCLHQNMMPTYWGVQISVSNGVAIDFCTEDPYDRLLTIIDRYPAMDGLQMRQSLKLTANTTEYMTRLFSHLSNMTSLRLLSISSSRMGVLPDNIARLSTLTFLNVLANSLGEIPESIGELKLLKYLDVSSNRLTHLPKNIGKLKSLTHLWMYNNSLVQLPNDIGQLSSLQLFNASNNQLSELPHFSSLDTFHLEWIDLSHNSLLHLHDVSNAFNITEEELVHLITSRKIILSHNPLRCVCKEYNIYQELNRYPHFANFTCGVPDSHGVLKQVGFNEFRCSPRINCPDGCICTDIPNQNLLTVDCHNYTGNILPHIMPVSCRNYSQYRYTLDFDGGSLVNLGNWDYLKKVVNASFSKNRIEEIPMGFFDNTKSFRVLKLDNNNIKTLPLLIEKWPEKIYLGHNSWRCSCIDYPTIEAIENNKYRIADYNDVKCNGPNNQKNKGFIRVINTLCSELNVPFIVVCTFLGVLIMVLMAIGTIYYKRVWVSKTFQWRPFQRDDPDDALKEYDVFVSYSNDDHLFVEDKLIPRLRDFGFKVCHHREHFLAGDSIIDNIHTAIFNSKRTLVFFSQTYKDSGYCMHEFRSALTLHVKNNRSHLITIKDAAIDIRTQESHLQSFFQLFTYIDRDSSKFWDNLLYALPVNRMNAPANGNVENAVQNENDMGEDVEIGDDVPVLRYNE